MLPRARAGQAALDFPGAPGIARARVGSSLPSAFAIAPFGPFERLASCCAGAAWCQSANEIGLALPQRLGHGERSVVHGDLATTVGKVEWLWVRRVVPDKRVALTVDEQIRDCRREIAVATPQPGVMVAPGLQQALLRRPGRSRHELQASRVAILQGLDRSMIPTSRPETESCIGAPEQTHSRWWWLKCSKANTCTGRSVAKAVPTPLVPLTVSLHRAPSTRFISAARAFSHSGPPR